VARKQADEIKKRVPWMGRRAWGVIYEHQRQYNKAEYDYLVALLETKEIKHPYYSLCYLYRKTKQFEMAIAALEQVSVQYPHELTCVF